ncbi:hypothetical protein [Sulfurimonas marina]|uniref:Uncharacterized protein n=1 Tax=Sulfurimonas marina TaxID=2590551 RepID=A0A7M1AVE6_9BACT|nr:hypothetical protein [Sulfurimonas marina]QOP41395.1 hypothetical protein FJR03_06410 [Sulfurimonas marina]
MNGILIILVIYLFLFNIITTFRLFKTDMYDSFQKSVQILILWIIPLMGAAFIAHFLNDEPLVLSEKFQKYVLLIKFLLLPFMIKVSSNLDKEIGNSNDGYQAEFPVSNIGGGD